eukprot:CAMPEP_0116851864 /NCGR_PEP_ID=MMETSP0418-20121206/16970_1 /TAXON_ID=1158023 /ORGANISM="Astrosyne radiata, Strain 13vi08-1A" /LENGTH=690 /DNA_ID=CAMNT_0004483955 /DNA_START=379 /DNA_END=2449 /DNA_ORIENTATION=+
MKVAMDQLQQQVWNLLPSMHSQREGGAAVAIPNNRILVVGGYHVERKFLKSCAVLDLNTRTWSDFPPMKTARMGCAAVYLEQHNAVVVLGGFQRGRKYLNTAEYLDLSTLCWHRLPPMQVPRAGCAAVTVLGKRVVVLGGWMNGETAVSTVEVLDFAAQQWHYLPEMATPRAGCAAAAIGYRVLVLGGHTTSGKFRGCRSSVEVLDLSTQKWGRLPSMREKRDASACCVVGNFVFIMGGGETSTSPLSSVELLDLEAQAWRDVPSMRSRRFGCAAAAVGKKIVVLGGRGSDGKHLETVEMLEIPGTDGGGNAPMSLGNFLDSNKSPHDANTDGADWKSAAESIVGNVHSMMEQDKARVSKSYQQSKSSANELYERTVSALEDRLRQIEKEKSKIQEQIQKARREREEAVARAEKDREEALAQIDTKMKPILDRAQMSFPSSSPDCMVSSQEDDLEPPSELCCCITGDLMDDPVTAMDGHTYERSAIEAWFARFGADATPTSPLTNEPLPSRRLIPSHNIRSQCKTWKAKLNRGEEQVDPLANLASSPGPSGGSSSQRGHSPNPSPMGRSSGGSTASNRGQPVKHRSTEKGRTEQSRSRTPDRKIRRSSSLGNGTLGNSGSVRRDGRSRSGRSTGGGSERSSDRSQDGLRSSTHDGQVRHSSARRLMIEKHAEKSQNENSTPSNVNQCSKN